MSSDTRFCLVHLIQKSDWVGPRGDSTQKLRISLAVGPLPYDKIAVEVLNLTTSRGFFVCPAGRRADQLGFRRFAISRLRAFGDPSIANNPPPPSGALPSRAQPSSAAARRGSQVCTDSPLEESGFEPSVPPPRSRQNCGTFELGVCPPANGCQFHAAPVE